MSPIISEEKLILNLRYIRNPGARLIQSELLLHNDLPLG